MMYSMNGIELDLENDQACVLMDILEISQRFQGYLTKDQRDFADFLRGEIQSKLEEGTNEK